MRAIAFASVATLLGFAAGLFGTYKMTPTIRTVLGKPAIVLDEQGAFDEVAAAGTAADSAGAEEASAIDPFADLPSVDSDGIEGALPGALEDSTGGDEGFGIDALLEEVARNTTPDAAGATGEVVSEGRAALAQNRQQVAEVRALSRENDALRNEVLDIKRQRAEATELSKTLVRLEDRELRQVLGELDLGTLEVLYGQVSLRNRIRLLQNMPPEKAASFIQQLTTNDPAAVLSEAEQGFSE